MYYHIFNLDAYFLQTNKYFSLFDGLFNLTNNKQNILKEVNIVPQTYRFQRMKTTVNKNIIDVLLKYFEYNDISIANKEEYEILLSKIYYCCYYKQIDNLKLFLDILNNKINENNILKPLLVLFKVLIIMNLGLRKSESDLLVNEDLKYLMLFYNTSYFSNDLELVYLVIMYYFDKIDNSSFVKIENLAIEYEKLSWFYYFIKGSKAYLKEDDIVAIINYDIVLEKFMQSNNLRRYFMVANNLAYLYNVKGEYLKSYSITSRVLEYVFSSNEDLLIKQNILMHYLFSNLMLERYKEIVDFVNVIIFDFNTLNTVSTIICLIASKKCNNTVLYNKIIQIDFQNEDYKNFINYFKTGNKKYLKITTNYYYYKKIKTII